ncbi:MAG: hypothetical protein DRH06_01300 [Deltaproteobacteria bacterium]|nr:MAG: hypothetical protein DRH07_02145 [Deltaproteobacteria bacterium]RLB78581.1 MAG: hypothetical protein DRH06_01300 [Deltaproteobacteria bacterium]
MKIKRSPCVNVLLLMLLIISFPLFASSASWDFSRKSISEDEIMSGGPPRDGIPALTAPKFLPASRADRLRDDEQILGVFLNGVPKAYPTRILSWHELVNDYFRDLPVLVSW